MLIATRGHRLRTTSATDAGASTYRGANLPSGVTISSLSLSTAFVGSPYDTSALAVGGTRYNAATTLTVSTTGATGRNDLMTHLATAAAGSTDYKIIVPNGTLIGLYDLPGKTDTTKHCFIVTAAIHAGTFGTAAGTKIPASTTGMTILQGPASSVTNVISMAVASARGYSLHGIVVQNDPASSSYSVAQGLIDMRRTAGGGAVLADYPGQLFIERSWLRGNPGTAIRRGICANGPFLKVLDSRITDVHQNGSEAAGIGGWSASQRHHVERCTIEAAGQAILYGGADPDQPGTNVLDPADIYTHEVYALKPLSWLITDPSYAGFHYDVKTGFEAKNVRRWLISNSKTQNMWADAQTGHAMLFQNLLNGASNGAANRTDDIVVRNHWFDNCAHGITLSAGVVPTISNVMSRVVLDNILMTRNAGITLQAFNGIQELIFDRITADGTRWLDLEGADGLNWAITNNIARGGTYGITRTGGPSGRAALLASCSGGGLNFAGNVMYDYDQGGGNYSAFSPGCDADETNSSMAFQDYAGKDYRLTTQQLTKGVSGGVPGADIATITNALAGVN